MQHPRNPIHGLTAADVMARVSVLIPHRMSMRAAARLLSRQRSREAAVVDGFGRCVGVLTAADFLRWIGSDGGADGVPPTSVWCDWQVVGPRPAGEGDVCHHVAADQALVAPTTHLAEVARLLLGENRPCVIVVDGQRRPIGIVATRDVLAAVTPTKRHTGGQGPLAEPSLGRRLMPWRA